MDQKLQQEWIGELAPHDKWNEKHFLAILCAFGIPKTYLDVGSGTGAMVNMARRMQIDAYGIDQLERDQDYLLVADLTQPFSLAERVGISFAKFVTCIEVAEHIPVDKHNVFCDTVVSHVERDGLMVWTSAHPGQDGTGHVGVKAAPYWHRKFHDRGLSYQDKLTRKLQLFWLNLGSPLFWLPANLSVWSK